MIIVLLGYCYLITGLFHDGQIFPDGTVDPYYLGKDGWAPIMGAGVSSGHDDQQPWMAAAGYMH
jgi:hypothetical protein